MTSFAAHKLLSVVGEVDPVKGIGNESETALEITEETERETEVVIEKERGNEYVIGTETEGREVVIEDNALLEAVIEDKQKYCIFFCVFTSSKFIFSCLLKAHCVEGFIIIFIPSMQ